MPPCQPVSMAMRHAACAAAMLLRHATPHAGQPAVLP